MEKVKHYHIIHNGWNFHLIHTWLREGNTYTPQEGAYIVPVTGYNDVRSLLSGSWNLENLVPTGQDAKLVLPD